MDTKVKLYKEPTRVTEYTTGDFFYIGAESLIDIPTDYGSYEETERIVQIRDSGYMSPPLII